MVTERGYVHDNKSEICRKQNRFNYIDLITSIPDIHKFKSIIV